MTATRRASRIHKDDATVTVPPWQDASRCTTLALIVWVALALPAEAAYVDAWGLPPGTPAPAIGAEDQDGNAQTLATLAGPNGLLLAFGRSVDWCPFCQRQVIDLATYNDRFMALGVRVAVITIDRPRKLKAFHSARSLPFPLLGDQGARHVRAFKVRNSLFGPRDPSYGIPYPGLVYIDAAGVIRARFAVEGYRAHPPPQAVLDAIAALVPANASGARSAGDAADAVNAAQGVVPPGVVTNASGADAGGSSPGGVLPASEASAD